MSTAFIFLILAVVLLGFINYLLDSKKNESPEMALLDASLLRCPACKNLLEIPEMLNASVFWGAGAIVFDCKHCADRVYFAPYEDWIETGKLGCSPVVDTIPCEKFAYSGGFEMTSSKEDGFLKITIAEDKWEIPKYGSNN
jgi:hypothetical protein